MLSRTAKTAAPCQSAGDEPQKCEAFSIFLLVAGRICFELSEKNIFFLWSGERASGESEIAKKPHPLC